MGLAVELPASNSVAAAHAVQSLDWVRPTMGEVGASPRMLTADDLAARRARMADARRAAEVACRKTLAGQRGLIHRFNAILALAQRYAILREQQAYWFTLGWPFMRRAVLRLSEELRQRGTIEQIEDVFYLTRAELVGHLAVEAGHGGDGVATGDVRAVVATRRREWERQRRLSPPLVLGNPVGARVIARATDAMRVSAATADSAYTQAEGRLILQGMPASPGRATGFVRIIRGPEDFERFQQGEVLVAQVTAPAWTPLFGLAAAVVTDGGSLAAHASLVAREFGIAAVVGTGDATARLRDGQRVTVDGSAGIVTVAS